MPKRIIQSIEELRALTRQEVSVSDWFTVTQEQINAFADLVDDHQWIHVDIERARAELPEGKTIAHGFLTLSLLSLLVKEAVVLESDFKRGVNYGFNRVRFPSPVPAGSRIRVRCTLLSLEEVPGGIQICWGVAVEIESISKPALVAEWLVRYYR